METINKATQGLTDTVEIEGESLIELLEGCMTHADKGMSALRALNSVEIRVEGESFIARATDRYRLIEGKIEGEGNLSPSLIMLNDVKRIVALFLSNKLSDSSSKGNLINNRVTLNRIGDLLTVSVGSSNITLNLLDATYPPNFDNLLKGESEAIESIAFNPAYFADYAKIVGKGVQVKVTFRGERKAILIGLIGNKVAWQALLMPMRTI